MVFVPFFKNHCTLLRTSSYSSCEFNSKRLYVTDLIPDAIICGVLSRSALAVECRTLHIFHYSHKMNHFCSITPFSNDTDHNNNSQPRHTGENRSEIALATNIFFVFSFSRTSLKLSLSFCFFSLSHSLTVSCSLCRSLFLFLFLSCSYTHELIQYCAVLYCTDKIG